MLYWESIIWPRHKALQKTWYRLHHLRLQQDRTLVSRRGVGSFLGGLCLDNGEGANVEQVHVRKALDKIFTTNFPPKTHMLFSMATFPSCTNRALKKNDHTPVRNQTASRHYRLQYDAVRLSTKIIADRGMVVERGKDVVLSLIHI